MEFELHFHDGTYFWKTMVKDVTETSAFQHFCKVRPELRQLLVTAKEAKKIQTSRRRSTIPIEYEVGNEIWVDVRCRHIFGLEWFTENAHQLNPRVTIMVPFKIVKRLGTNHNRIRICPRGQADERDLEIFEVDGEFMESYAYAPIAGNSKHDIPVPYAILRDRNMKPPFRFQVSNTPIDGDGNLVTPAHFDTVDTLHDIMQLRVIEFTPAVGMPSWKRREHPKLPTVANRKPTTKPT
jgi:hypothetical protein